MGVKNYYSVKAEILGRPVHFPARLFGTPETMVRDEKSIGPAADSYSPT